MKIILATHNKNKLEELKEMLLDTDIEIISPVDLEDNEEIEETGNSFKENAYLKAHYFYEKYKMRTIADDSGLCCVALDNAPGIFSARYAGDDCNSEKNNEKLLNDLETKKTRKASFVSVICYIDEKGNDKYFDGQVKGIITRKQYGAKGFGYDPIFIPEGYNKTFGQMSNQEKNHLSHRYRAFIKLAEYLVLENALEKTKEVLNAKEVVVSSRLLGGMSNYTYVIKADENLYTLRILGEYAEKFVSRKEEAENIPHFEKLGITNQTIYFNVDTGLKIAKYVEGKPLSEIDNSKYPMEKVADLLKKIHASSKENANDYSPFSRLEKYENLLKEKNFEHSKKYNRLRKYFFLFKDYLEQTEKVFCHGDSQPSNFILNNDDLLIVDFEFSGMNDPLYDIACFSNSNEEDGLKLLHVYYDHVTTDLLLRFYLWRCFQGFQWYNVAMFKELVGLSNKLHIDFKLVSEKYLTLVEDLLIKIDQLLFKK